MNRLRTAAVALTAALEITSCSAPKPTSDHPTTVEITQAPVTPRTLSVCLNPMADTIVIPPTEQVDIINNGSKAVGKQLAKEVGSNVLTYLGVSEARSGPAPSIGREQDVIKKVLATSVVLQSPTVLLVAYPPIQENAQQPLPAGSMEITPLAPGDPAVCPTDAPVVPAASA